MGQSSIASTVDKLWFAFLPPSGETAGSYYIDIAQCLSIVNRRSYRQGMNYAVDNMSFKYAPLGPTPEESFMSIVVSKVPTTWAADNSTTKAFEFWKEQRAEVLKEQPSLKAKWSDFKIFLDANHVNKTIAENLIPHSSISDSCGSANVEFLKGEWDASEIVFPVTGGSGGTGAANQQTMHVVGNNLPAGAFQVATGTSFSLIEAYANSRRTPQSPDPSTTGVSETTNPYATLAAPDSTFQDIAENVLEHNAEAPYDLDDYPGGTDNAPFAQIVKKMYPSNFGSTTNVASVSIANTGSFLAPFGLVRIDTCGLSSSVDYIIIEMDIVPGRYKGVLAEKGV